MRWVKILGAVAVINVIARLLGFAREVVIGYQYGTTYVADSIITAFTVPNFIYLVVGGAITTAFISVYSKLAESKKQLFINNIWTILLIILSVLTVISIVFAEYFIHLLFSGLSGPSFQLTVHLYQVMAPSSLFLVIGMWLSGLWNIQGYYRLTAFATLVFNGVFLTFGAGLTGLFSTYSYAVGAVAGAFLMAFLLYTKWLKEQRPISFQIGLGPNRNEMWRFMKLALPILLGGATLQFYFLIQRIYASQLEEGIIASLNYASKMTQFPQAILMTSVTTVMYPLLSKAVGDNQNEKVSRIYQKGIRWLFILLVPATAFLMSYAKPIISVIFEYGQFDEQATARTYPLLQWLALSMLPLAMNTYITRFFYAKEQSYLPVFYSMLSVFGINIFIINMYIDQLGVYALAVGTIIATVTNMIFLMITATVKYRFTVGNPWEWSIYVLLASGLIVISKSVVASFDELLMLACGGLLTAVFILVGLRLFK
ncbi:murein biosynthesis integral membrane protein MurJ [Gracilibacillus caseinilyticus]|uniref:Murein biosynthesis integral membrane protein MurJ n=1 Tax=Gracilibacillus caseinilyticus TaxID=2932256 RepID=A0ABY4F294_9BACI|nr:murein biosynthesis integral membrane protein MurJ [Gracilibacillus caseinilyticus]UOQ50292.1 murein biosynthesis integral membrane protein MurJ [Gracilibacillus caseinilyticus]